MLVLLLLLSVLLFVVAVRVVAAAAVIAATNFAVAVAIIVAAAIVFTAAATIAACICENGCGSLVARAFDWSMTDYCGYSLLASTSAAELGRKSSSNDKFT